MHTLTDSRIRSISPTGSTQRLFDGGGLYLEVSPAGGRWWRLKYRHQEKEKRVSLGVYPTVTLKEARDKALELKRQLGQGVDPSAERQAVKAARSEAVTNSFEALAREWYETRHKPTVSPGQSKRVLSRLEGDVFPWLGKLPITELTGPSILQAMRRVETRGAVETAHRELQTIGQVFRYAVATGRAQRDPTADLKGALKPFKSRHMPALTDPQQVGALLRAIDGYQGSFPVRCALQLSALLFVRPGELRFAEWAELDLDAALWRIPSARMKRTVEEKAKGADHLVPLSRQAVSIFKELQPLTRHRAMVFPSTRGEGRVLSDATLGAALRRLGYCNDEMTAHGFRAMARTMLVERLGVEESIIEAQLAHRVRDALGRAYNRTQFVDQRRNMMQKWADYLDKLKAGADVIKLKLKRAG